METSEQKRRRLFGKQFINTYLQEINKLVNISIDASDLLSIVETDNILGNSVMPQIVKYKSKFPFRDKPRLRDEVCNNTNRIDHGLYLYIHHSTDCGLVAINSLSDFNFDFNFTDVSSGLITLISNDLHEKIIFDFDDEGGNEYIEVEIYNV